MPAFRLDSSGRNMPDFSAPTHLFVFALPKHSEANQSVSVILSLPEIPSTSQRPTGRRYHLRVFGPFVSYGTHESFGTSVSKQVLPCVLESTPFGHGHLILFVGSGYNKCRLFQSYCIIFMYDVLFVLVVFLAGVPVFSWAWLYEELKTIDGCVCIGRV